VEHVRKPEFTNGTFRPKCKWAVLKNDDEKNKKTMRS
jgi:hypothetical protein